MSQQPRPFRRLVDVLSILSKGRFVEKCDEHFVKAIEHLQAQRGGGTATLTLTLTIKLDDEGRADLVPAIKSKLPEEKGFQSTPLWALDGGLSAQHPSQFDIFTPREVSRAGNE